MFKAFKHGIGIGNPVKGYLLEQLLPAIQECPLPTKNKYGKMVVVMNKTMTEKYQQILDKKNSKLGREKQGNVRCSWSYDSRMDSILQPIRI
jgi:hypothetical protein